MEDTEIDGYTASELINRSPSDLLQLLRSSWGFQPNEQIDVIGLIKEIKLEDSRSLFLLHELRSLKYGTALFYPVKNLTVRQHTVFIGNKNSPSVRRLMKHNTNLDGVWATTQVELSPLDDRTKRANPFAMQSMASSVQILHELPDAIGVSANHPDEKLRIEQWVIDFYRDKNLAKVAEESESLKRIIDQEHAIITKENETLQQASQQQLTDAKQETERLQVDISVNEKRLARDTNVLREIQDQLQSINITHKNAERNFQQQSTLMNNKLSALNGFIEKKAKTLLDLGLVSQSEVDGILGIQDADMSPNGHSFADVFSSDTMKGVGYIHAYLQNKGIVYRRTLLEDFFALLTTHDLIVLAGDSGSGKTNLVKSFAEAIGGKAIIVPVKPNWTSAEDLLGYYNPLEQKYLSTPFLDAIFEATRNPDIPYLICLDEMNLARVEYYFADFLSLMEERTDTPEIYLYSDSEAEHLVSEARTFLSLIDIAKDKLDSLDAVSFLDLLKDETLNKKLHELCGFTEGDSLLKYHARLRKLMSSYLKTPSSIHFPSNIRIIGAINVDETTHYLSPKILDRAHILRFSSPLLMDWDEAEAEVEVYDLDMDLPLPIDAAILGTRMPYPKFDRHDALVVTLIELARNYLEPLGIEFGLRTIRQAQNYGSALHQFNVNDETLLNNIVLHKVLPKLMFDGEQLVGDNIARKDILKNMRDYLDSKLNSVSKDRHDSCVNELDRVIRIATANDWVVNYWTR